MQCDTIRMRVRITIRPASQRAECERRLPIVEQTMGAMLAHGINMT